MYENESQVNCILKNLGSNLSIYHHVSVFVRGSIIPPSIVSKDIIVDPFIGPMDRVYRCALCRFSCPLHFASERQEINNFAFTKLNPYKA
jgi:hypothetical protein